MSDEDFQAWMARVDAVLQRHAGLTSGDLADQTWRDWFDDGIKPGTAAAMAVRSELAF